MVGVTGTPGTGKKSVAPLLASKLGYRCAGLNELSLSHGLVNGADPNGEVDVQELRRVVREEVSGESVVYGHLVPYVLERRSVASVAVLRCEPGVLKSRLLKRGYPSRKLVENIEAELIGLVSSDAYDAFGESKTFEVDTTYTSPSEAVKTAVGILKKTIPAPSRIDWTNNYDSGAKLRSLLAAET